MVEIVPGRREDTWGVGFTINALTSASTQRPDQVSSASTKPAEIPLQEQKQTSQPDPTSQP